MGVLRPVGFLILIILMALLGAYLIGAEQIVLGEIFVGTAAFLLLAGAAVLALVRYEKRSTQNRRAESRLLYFFRRWLMRVDARDYQYMKYKYREKNRRKPRSAYLEEFTPTYLDELRQVLPDNLNLSDVGVIQRLDGEPVDGELVLAALERLGWDVYYLRRATSGQYYAYYFLKREVIGD